MSSRARLLFSALALAACTSGVAVDPGSDAWLRVPAAQFVRGPFPGTERLDGGAADGALRVSNLSTVSSIVPQGFHGKAISGLATQGATNVAVSLATLDAAGAPTGDIGYWLAPVGLPSLEVPGTVDFMLSLDFARELPLGPVQLLVAPEDASGGFGETTTLNLTVVSSLPVGDLVVALDWTADMDLDLRVVAPDGSVLTFDGVRTAEHARVPAGPGVPFIDIDSNANCVLDGARAETAVWDAAPAGTYQVFVRATASCGLADTGWRIRILRGTDIVATVHGASYASEVNAPGGGTEGNGRLATTFATGD